MPVIEAKEFIKEKIISVAKEVALSAMTAPQVTNKTKIEAAIVYGREELLPHVEIFEAIAEVIWAIKGEANNLRKVVDEDLPFAMVLVGAKMDRSDLNYDCNACGFPSCAEFNRYTKKHLSFGGVYNGPCCAWKVLDWSISWDFGAAVAYSHNLPSRVHGTFGMTAGTLGYLPECTNMGGISLGPIFPEKGRVWEYWYSRDTAKEEKATKEDFFANYVTALPSFWVAAPAFGIKAYAMHTTYFHTEARHFSLREDPKLLEKYQKLQERIAAIAQKYTGEKVERPVL